MAAAFRQQTIACGARRATANSSGRDAAGASARRNTPRLNSMTSPSSRHRYRSRECTPRSIASCVVKVDGSPAGVLMDKSIARLASVCHHSIRSPIRPLPGPGSFWPLPGLFPNPPPKTPESILTSTWRPSAWSRPAPGQPGPGIARMHAGHGSRMLMPTTPGVRATSANPGKCATNLASPQVEGLSDARGTPASCEHSSYRRAVSGLVSRLSGMAAPSSCRQCGSRASAVGWCRCSSPAIWAARRSRRLMC